MPNKKVVLVQSNWKRVKTTPDKVQKFFEVTIIIDNYECLAYAWPEIKLKGLTKFANVIQQIHFSNFYHISISLEADPHPGEANKFLKINPLVVIMRTARLSYPEKNIALLMRK